MEKGFNKKGFYFFIKVSLLATLFYVGSYYSMSIFFDYINYKNNVLPIEEKIRLTKNITASVIESRNVLDATSSEIHLAFVGDIMLDRGVYSKILKYGDGNFNFPFLNIKNDLSKYDFLVGNLEGPVSDKGIDKRNLYSFRMNPEVIGILKGLGFKALSVANNHAGDWGPIALEDTISRLNSSDIKVIGGGFNSEEANAPRIIEINGTIISFLAFSAFGAGQYESTQENSGIAVISEDTIKNSIEEARNISDIVVVSFHFGDEYKTIQNKTQEKYAKMAVDYGANLVIGHHPHVVQPLDMYKNAYISYSLGNFVFDQYFSEETMEGGLLEVDIKDKSIYSVDLRKTKMNKNYQPELAEI